MVGVLCISLYQAGDADASELSIESFAEFMRNSGHVLEQLEESLAATQAQRKVVAARGQ